MLTFNTHHGKGMDRRVNLNRISNIIKSSNADIIGLNEVDNQFSRRSNFENQALWLANELKMDYVFGPAITYENQSENIFRQYGNALLSRLPIIKSENHPFDFLPRVAEDRALLEADIKIGDEIFTVYVTHLSFAPFQHRKQTEFILKKVSANPYSSIVLGDWNMKPFSKSWRLVTEYLKDVNPGHEKNYTYPSRRPNVKLDYIFISREIEVISAGVFNAGIIASDHLPYMTTIMVNQ
nr:endonuclease/exonuclease/phosphatase family protein [Bacillus sp. J33]